MKPHWLSILCCIAMMALHSSAAPTEDTFVVAKSETKTTIETTDHTTEEPVAPIKLTQMRVHSEVSLRYAVTSVVTHVRNPARRSQEATFHVLLPETAFISEFVMTLSGKSYKAYVKEKEEAKKIYTEAVSQGVGAAHIAAKARDSNHFTVSVNVEPNSEAVFNLTYEELLVRRIGVYNHAVNLHPGALVPRMEVTVHIKESQKISLLRVPEVRTGNEIDATENDAPNSKVVINKSSDDKEATITFTPDLEEQKRLMHVYAEKIKESASSRPRWYSSQNEEDKTPGVLGQFVVQYDVERPENGEILVNDGYFVHFFAPKSLKPLSKLVVFVLDTSSSMGGRKIEQLRDAMQAILSDLHHTDYFSIVEFNSYVTVHELSEAQAEPPRPRYPWMHREERSKLVAPSPATSENIEKAKVIVSRLSATGGTNIYDALDVAVDVINYAYTPTHSNDTKDEPISDELQPIIIFLTDGDATVGQTNPSRILSYITEKNSGDKKATIYSLAFGHDADRSLLRKLSLRNEGFMRQIYEASDAALQLHHFYQQVSSPLLTQVNFVYPPDQVKEGSVTKHAFVTMFSGSEVVVAGALVPAARELAPSVTALSADDLHGRKHYEVKNKVVVKENNEYLPLERLWAYLSVKQLLDKRDALDQENDKKSLETQALAIALKYSFVTPLTSLVVVKPNATNAVDAESVDRPGHSSYSFLQRPSFAPAGGLGSYGAVPLSASFLPSRVLGGGPVPLIVGGQAFLQQESGYSSGFTRSALSGQAPARFHSLSSKSYSARPAIHYHTLSGFQDDLDEPDYQIAPYSSHRVSFDMFDIPRPLFINNAPPASTTAPAITTPAATTSLPATTTEALETTYHLENYNWAVSLVNRDTNSLEFEANGQNVTLELSTSDVPPKAAADSECAHSVGSSAGAGAEAGAEAGVCVYLTRCAAATDIALDEFRNTYCVVDNKYAGVCCPRNKVDTTTP